MTPTPRLQADCLNAPRLSHAFFTRLGGVSTGLYASLNGGVGSRDEAANVSENRARMAAALGVERGRFLVPYQVHSPDVVAVVAPWARDQRPRCDGVVSATPGLGLGVTGADCGIILFADADAGVIGAAHAGWKGALGGIVEATVAAMVALGARASHIAAALGPCIAQASYEVGPEFIAAFEREDAHALAFFQPSQRAGHAMFNLKGYIALRAKRADLSVFEDLGLDTYADEERFYSYRRATHRREADYGRLVAGIALK